MQREGTDAQRPAVVDRASGVVAEIGFGSGLNIPYYKNVTKLYAVDPSQGLYDLGRERIATASFPVEHIRASAEDIPLSGESIDAAVSRRGVSAVSRIPSEPSKKYVASSNPEGSSFLSNSASLQMSL